MARSFSFSWIDAASASHLLDFAHAEEHVEGEPLGWGSFYSYGEVFSPTVALTREEHLELWTLIEAAGVLTLAEGQVKLGAGECCLQPGYSAAV